MVLIVVSTISTIFRKGHHMVWWTVTNISGEPSACIFREVCSSAEKPKAECSSKTQAVSTKPHCYFIGEHYLNSAFIFLSFARNRLIVLFCLHVMCIHFFYCAHSFKAEI